MAYICALCGKEAKEKTCGVVLINGFDRDIYFHERCAMKTRAGSVKIKTPEGWEGEKWEWKKRD